MARPNYQHEKRQKDLAKRKQQEEKRKRKMEKKKPGTKPAENERPAGGETVS